MRGRRLVPLTAVLALTGCYHPVATDGFEILREPIGSMAGPEDIALYLPEGGSPRLLVSAYDRRRERPGAIYSVDLDDPAGVETLFTEAGGEMLFPHGIAVARSEWDGVTRLLAINHLRSAGGTRHRVEVYRLDGRSPGFETTLTDEALSSPNDLVLTPEGDIFLTNELNYRHWALKALEFFRLWRTSHVVHTRYRGEGDVGPWRKMAVGFRYANGIETIGSRLYVAGTLDRAVWELERPDADDKLWRKLRKIRIGSGVDNLIWGEEDGVRFLYAAAHPEVSAFLRHAKDPSEPSPSAAYRIDVRPETPPADRVERIFYDGGERLSGSSAAVVFRDRLYLGQVFGSGVAVCRRVPET